MMQNDLLQAGLHGSFVADGFGSLPAAALPLRTGGKLVGERLAVKDVFDVAGLRTGSGNLAWRDEQPVATRTALAVRALLEEGAQWLGKTVTDELTYSLAGVNAHYGTPVNPSDPARIPGGSSSGSVVAVAAGHADIALGGAPACELLRRMGHAAHAWPHCGRRLPHARAQLRYGRLVRARRAPARGHV
jgi:amidase